MKVLIGTTNPSKVKRFAEFLDGCDVEFYTLKDLEITDEPEEMGNTPEENAIIKAKFYGKYFDVVICNDSGLYFDELPLDDPRQPGLNIRTPQGSKRLDDEEMITYYSDLVRSLGGKVLAFYLDGIAVYNHGKIHSYIANDESTRADAFYMVDTPSMERREGWPLDSLSVNRNTMTYFVDRGNNIYDKSKENVMIGEYRKRVVSFLKEALGLHDTMKVNETEYRIIKLLGHGKGGFSYLAEKDGKQYVLKQIHHEPCDYYTFGNKIEAEQNDYHRLLTAGIRIPKMLDIDIDNERILKEYIDGPTIFDLVKQDSMKEIYLNQLREMATKAYDAGLNIDYFPTNFVVQDELIYYIDYECNNYMDEWNFENWGMKYWSKTPEFMEYVNNH